MQFLLIRNLTTLAPRFDAEPSLTKKVTTFVVIWSHWVCLWRCCFGVGLAASFGVTIVPIEILGFFSRIVRSGERFFVKLKKN
jgi:hypothetical protein